MLLIVMLRIFFGQRMPLVCISLEPRLTNLGRGVMPFDMFMPHPILQALAVILLLLDICLQILAYCSIMIYPGDPTRVMRNDAEAFQRVGVKPGDLGSHSTRKGACSLAASKSTVSPPIVSICL
eukprot:CCRYP_010347-RA/>CCRYP_010347-RA protein AED:0.34 eAED:0.72 QI:0/0/0/1/0/0.5/2/0/123